MIQQFHIRASYPNYYMVRLYAQQGAAIFNHDSEDPANQLEGNKPGTVIYTIAGEEKPREIPPRWYDMYCLLKRHGEEQRHFLELLVEEREGVYHEELKAIREDFLKSCRDYVERHPLVESPSLITTLSEGDFNVDEISHKGRMLLDLTRHCYPVPDFCIMTSAGFHHPEMIPTVLEQAISNLEAMTTCRLGSRHNPLVFAIRCAMPQYIPGLMPTLLNIGVTRQAYEALREMYVDNMANRVYLSTLHSISEMLGIDNKFEVNDINLNEELQAQRIEAMEEDICNAREDGERLLNDAHYQALQLVLHVRQFYLNNQDLILTFMQGKQASPSLIIQRMVWTIGNNDSYPGVLYSRHSRTGQGKQIESYRNIFGEEIMTGDVTSEDRSYQTRNEIIDEFPAVYHFDPLLKKLESRYKTPVTIEFAVETRPHQLSLFSVLQLNMSEMTGRAALISSINMYNEGLIRSSDVVDLIKPYHLRQIISASIDDASISKLQFFSKGLSVLPRTALTAVVCFSATRAREQKAKGETVCLCQERFIPEDTITLNEVDGIISMTPAAIHVVTACRGYGIPAFMDLQSYGIRMVGNQLINTDGLVINELDKITISSKRQTIYKGVAAYKPARFSKYLQGIPVELCEEEKRFFNDMKVSYEKYQQIVTNSQSEYINDINKLARLIRCDLQNKPDVARTIVNSWYQQNEEAYVRQVLQSKMGDHQDQSRVFNLLSNDRKIDFFRKTCVECLKAGLSGLKAGSFMIGRFVAKPLPLQVWNSLSDTVVAFMLNEYVLYEKYLHVLEEVGEIRLARAHSRIETEGIDNMNIQNFDLDTFVTLVYSIHDWENVAAALEDMDHQSNTHRLVEILSQPPEKIYDMSQPWKRASIEAKLKS